MSSQAERLTELLKTLKTNQLQFSNAIGVKSTQTNAIAKGRGEFSKGYLKKVRAVYPNVNLHWLLTGTGNMIVSPSETQSPVSVESTYQKSIISVLENLPGNDEAVRETLSINLNTLHKKWGMGKNELFALLYPGVQKQTVTNYFNGSSQPPLWVLLRLEQITGVTLSAWLNRLIQPAEIPKEPVFETKGGEDLLYILKTQLHVLLDMLEGGLPDIARHKSKKQGETH